MMSPKDHGSNQAESTKAEPEPTDTSENVDVSEENPDKLPAVSNGGGDVERFGGKIVYNPDGSAYIIEDGDLSDDESLPIPKQEGSIVERPGDEDDDDKKDAYPQIANAFYISKSTAYYNALYGQAYVKLLQEKNVPETPVVHSYRVFSARDKNVGANTDLKTKHSPLVDYVTVPVKPILMCFICKLSLRLHPVLQQSLRGRPHVGVERGREEHLGSQEQLGHHSKRGQGEEGARVFPGARHHGRQVLHRLRLLRHLSRCHKPLARSGCSKSDSQSSY